MKGSRLLTAVVLSLAGIIVSAQPGTSPQGPINQFLAIEGTSVLNYNMRPERDIHSRAGFGPAFYVFPDSKLDNGQALELVERLNLIGIVKEYGGRILIVNPSSGKWQDQDLETFTGLIGRGGAPTNIKVVGLGSGATFVNRQLSATDLTGAIAGIVSIDGEPGKTCKYPVPAFIGGKNAAKVAKPYQAASDSAPADPLQKVVVNTDKKASWETLFAQAWDKVLSANYRYNNLFHTFYMSRGIDNREGVKNFELVSIPVFDKIGIQRNVVEYPLVDMNAPSRPDNPDKYLWYEYIPKQALGASPGTVPLVVLLHGHGNDPRTQSETSGFPELAAEEGFMVVEMEWQGGKGYAPMGLDGIEAVISVLRQKYPQIDGSRIYADSPEMDLVTMPTAPNR